MHNKFDTLIKVKDLKTYWANEAKDFTPWLSENINLLADAINIEIESIDTESPVGDFRVDIFAKESNGDGRKIIIENQLEDTNHDHLGKLITYASGKDAEIVVWIVKRAREEHKRAIEWLNEHTDESAAFFLIEMELWKIGDSKPAPHFNVVEQPNGWAKNIKNKSGMTQGEILKIDFWTAFKDYASQKDGFSFSLRKPSRNHWYNLAIGKGKCYIQLTVDTNKNIISAGIMDKTGQKFFNQLKSQESAIETFLGLPLEWHEAPKESRMRVVRNADFSASESWPELFEWLISYTLKLRETILTYTK